MVPRRSAHVLRSWLNVRDQDFRDRVQVVRIDGFTGYASAVEEKLPDVVNIMGCCRIIEVCQKHTSPALTANLHPSNFGTPDNHSSTASTPPTLRSQARKTHCVEWSNKNLRLTVPPYFWSPTYFLPATWGWEKNVTGDISTGAGELFDKPCAAQLMWVIHCPPQ
ncbi:transposase [Corynebacterium sp. A21]|uniref:transposase n=1 Tax=Corynebacterium sp. A21 TaxID=3457318 RepID=UPI003FD688AE